MAAYGSYYASSGIFLDGVFGYGRLRLDSRRYVSAPGGSVKGKRDGSVAVGFEYRSEHWPFSPYARLESALTNPETGDTVNALTFGGQSINYFSSTIGARIEYTRDFSGQSQVNIGYADTGWLLPYAIHADLESRGNVKIETGIEAQIHNRWSIGLDYGMRVGVPDSAIDHSFRVKFMNSWRTRIGR